MNPSCAIGHAAAAAAAEWSIITLIIYAVPPFSEGYHGIDD
jgi:hypothetical protein